MRQTSLGETFDSSALSEAVSFIVCALREQRNAGPKEFFLLRKRQFCFSNFPFDIKCRTRR